MSNYNADIELEALAKLNTNSSEEEIKKGIRILENRLRNSSDGKIHLSADLDQSSLNQLIKKLQTLLKNKKLGLSTKESIVEIQKEAKSMLEVVSAASKASKEKLKFADANKKVKDSARNTSNVINQERSAMGRLNDINYIMQNINARANTGNSIFQQFGVTLRDAFYYYSAANLLQRSIYKVIDAGKESIETVKELNDAAVSLQMATGKNYEYISQLMKSYNELGQEIGATTKSVAESADAWLRQGHTIEDTNTLINDSMILSKIANMDSADSTKYLTSAMQGYKVAVGDVIGIVDKLSAVDLVSANSADGLAEAISRTAEGAQIAGVSMDRLLAMVATVGEVTQKSMSSIGESYKTIFSRMRDIKDNKLSVIGEDGEIEDLSNVEIVLNSLGIKLRESNQEFRNFQDVLDEVANEWNNYSTVQQAAIGKAFSGVRQQENFLVMMENYDKVKKYTEVAANSSGTSEEKFDYYLDSLEAKTESLKASLEGLATTTISKELYSSVLDVTKGFVDAATESGVLKATLAGLATSGAIYAISQLTTYLGSAAQGFANLSEAMLMTRGNVAINDMQRLADLTVGLSASQTRLVLTTNTLTDAQKIAILMNQGLTEQEARLQIATWGVAAAEQGATAATITMGSVMSGVFATISAHPFVAITLAIGTGVVAINKYLSSLEERQKKLKEKAEEAKTAINDLSSTYESHKKTIEECANSYERLSKGVNTFTNENFNLSDEEYQTYLNTVNSISEVFPQLRTGIDENGNAIIQFSDKTKSATENLYDFLEAEKYTANYKIAQELPDLFGGVQIYNKELTSLKDKYDSVNESAAGCLDVVKGMTDLSNPLKDEYEFTIDNTTEIGVNTFNVLSKAVQNYIDIMHEAGRHDINDWLNWEHIFGDIDNLGRTKIHLNLPDAYFTPEDKVAFQTLVQTALSDLMPDLTDEIGEYQQELKTKTSEFEASWIDFRANLVNAMHSKASYQGFDDVSKNIADQLVGNLSSDIASKMDDDDPYKYIQDNIISALIIPPNETAEQKKVRESFINKMNQLLTFDGNESELNSFVEAFQLWLDQNGFNIDITPIANIKQDSIEQETQKAIEDTNKKILSFSEAWKNLSVDGDLSTKLLKLASDGELTGFKIEELAEKEELLKQAMDDTGLSAEKFAEKLRELNIDNIKSDIVTFTDSLNKLKNGQILSLEETTKLITADNKLAGAVKKVGDGYVIEKDAIKDVINSHKEKYNIAISYEVQQTQTTIQNTKARITEMKTEMSALKELVEAYQMAISARNKLSGTTSGSYSDELALIEAQKQQESVDKELSKKNKKLKKAEKKLQQLLAGLKNTESKGKSDSSSQKSSQQFDFIQIKLERLQNQYQKYISKAENGTLSLTKRTNNYSKALSNLTKQINTQDKAYTKYMNKANKVKLSDNLKKKIREGSIDIRTLKGKTADNAEEFQKYYNLALDSKDKKTDLKNTKKETKRNLIQLEVDDLANKLSAEEAISNELQKQIDLKESLGDKGSDSDYSSTNKSLAKQIDIIKKQNDKIKEQQKTVKNGSEEWYKYQESIDSNNNSIKDLTQSMIDNATQGIKSVNDALDEGISKLDDSDELLRAKSDNATNANEKNSFLQGIIGNIKGRKSIYDSKLKDVLGYRDSAITTINSTPIDNADIYTKIQSCISSNTEIPSDIIVSLNNPTLAVACAQYNEALASYDTINAAKKLYDETSKTDIQSQLSAQRDNIESSANEQLESISADETKLQADINKSEAAGLSQSKAQYTEQIRLSKEREKTLQNEHSQLENWLSDMMASGEIVKGDEQYEKTQNNLKNIEADLINCTADEIKFNSAIEEMDLSRLEKLVSLLDVVKNRLSGLASLAESHGHNASDDLLLKQIEFSFTETKTYKDMIEESLKSLRNPENLSQWGISEDLMEDLITLVQNGKVNEAEQILKDKGIDIENLTAIHEKFDKIASSTSSCYSAMVEGEKYYDSLIQNRIDMINEYLDKLQKEKDLKDRTLALEKARFALEQAKNNLTKKIWNGEEWVYSADTDAIQSAQEAYDDAEYEELTNSLNDLVDVLERLMKDHNLYDDNGNLTENGEDVKRVLSDIDAKELPNVLKALIERGFSEEELTSIAKSNGVDISSQMHSDVLQSLMDDIRANPDMTKWLYDYENFPAPQINIPNVYDTANLDSLTPSSKTIGNNFHFDKVEFILPNVNDSSKANDLINEVYGQLSNLNLYAKQYNWDD